MIGTRSAVFAPISDLGLVMVWDDGDDTCVRTDVRMEDDGERDELASAMSDWAGEHGNASTEVTAAGDVRFTACG